MVSGSSVTTAAFRAVVSAFVGGLIGFAIDYFSAQAPQAPGMRMAGPGRGRDED